MVDVDDIRRKLHEMSSAITVVESFILRFDSTHVEDEMLRELHEASLPDKAIDLVDESASKLRMMLSMR